MPKRPFHLIGGLKSTRGIIKKKLHLGSGLDRNVHEVSVDLGGRKVKSGLVYKEYNDIDHNSKAAEVYSPKKQFNNFERLKKLNRDKKAGLKIINTFRLTKKKGEKPGILATKLNNVSYDEVAKLGIKETQRILSEIDKQRMIAHNLGFYVTDRAFVFHKNKDGVIEPIIADFKFVTEINGLL